MKIDSKEMLRELEPGQLWKIEHGYVHIVQLGDPLVHYRILRQPEQPVAITRMIGLEALLNFLQQSDAELLANP
ncbi:MAG: hypothetical protein ACREIC_14580 [Limisphaerales bacterium]